MNISTSIYVLITDCRIVLKTVCLYLLCLLLRLLSPSGLLYSETVLFLSVFCCKHELVLHRPLLKVIWAYTFYYCGGPPWTRTFVTSPLLGLQSYPRFPLSLSLHVGADQDILVLCMLHLQPGSVPNCSFPWFVFPHPHPRTHP